LGAKLLILLKNTINILKLCGLLNLLWLSFLLRRRMATVFYQRLLHRFDFGPSYPYEVEVFRRVGVSIMSLAAREAASRSVIERQVFVFVPAVVAKL
jgi:hypothetical protein